MRTLVIGDIHGCNKALNGLLEVIQPASDDTLIFLGDYVDRGPDSRGVLDTLIALKSQINLVCLLGNHEIMFRGVIQGLNPALWLEIGGRPTLTSYGGKLSLVPEDHLDFLCNLLPYYETDEHLFVHANYDAALPLTEQPEELLYWEHLGNHFPQPHTSGKHVFLGHTPQPYGKIGEFDYFTCLDTGCFAGYWLSAMDVDSGEMWQISKHGHRREDWRIIRRIYRFLFQSGRKGKD